MINDTELLMGTYKSDQNVSVHIWNCETVNVESIYKNGGTVARKTLHQLGNDYILAAEENKPLLHIWPINSQEQVKNMKFVMPEKVTTLDADPSNNYLAAGIGLKLYVWHLSSGKLMNVLQKNYQPITCVKFSNTGEHLIVSGDDGMLLTYMFSDVLSLQNNYLTQSEIGKCEPLYSKLDNSSSILDIYTGAFGAKSRLATVSADQTCRIYDLHTGERLLILVFNSILTTVILDLPCWNVFVGDDKGLIRQVYLKNPPRTLVHHFNTTQKKFSFVGHTKKINCMHLNISNSMLASGSEDCCIIIWEIKSRNIIRKIEKPGSITNLHFILNHQHLHAQTIKPTVILKPFQRSCETEFNNYNVSINQDFDITFNDEDSKHNVNDLMLQELNNAKMINHQLYQMFVKQYNMN